MLPYFADVFGNPSSIHSCGQETRLAVEAARTRVAALIGARSEEMVFTSGGTEADNLALKGVALAKETKGNHIITTRIEHHAVIETCKFLESRGFKITYLAVDGYGLVDPEDVRRAITDKTILISVIHASNEIGTIEPVAEIAKLARQAGVYFHTDAVQAVGHIPIDVAELGVDLLSISAHKFYGPKGTGALYVRKGTRLTPIMHGGGQERGLRSGTENVAAIVGLGKAAEIALEEMSAEAERLTYLRHKLIMGILEKISGTHLNGHPSKRLPNNVNVSIDGVEGEAACINLSLRDICASTGSACSSSSVEPSHVLLALGRPREQAHNSLRFSLGKWTTEPEIGRALEVLPQVVARLRG